MIFRMAFFFFFHGKTLEGKAPTIAPRCIQKRFLKFGFMGVCLYMYVFSIGNPVRFSFIFILKYKERKKDLLVTIFGYCSFLFPLYIFADVFSYM